MFIQVTLPSFDTTTVFIRMGDDDIFPLPDNRHQLAVPITTYAYNAFSVSAINLVELVGDPSNFSDSYFGAYPARVSRISPAKTTIYGMKRDIHTLHKHERAGTTK